VRVPLVVRWPGVAAAGHVAVEMVGLEDLYPTLLRVARAPLPRHALHGRDLVPLLRGERPRDWRQAAYLETVTFGGLEGLRVLPGRVQRGVRTADWKLILSEDGEHELYHLAEDPEEEADLYRTPRDDPHGRFAHLPSYAHVIEGLADSLASRARELGDDVGGRLGRSARAEARERLHAEARARPHADARPEDS
jgi:arylsulfatase A-like enzyme